MITCNELKVVWGKGSPQVSQPPQDPDFQHTHPSRERSYTTGKASFGLTWCPHLMVVEKEVKNL